MRGRPSSRGKRAELQPCIAELLRTRVHQAGTVLRVERIIERDITPDDQVDVQTGQVRELTRTFRLVLGDGELLVQAVADPALHRLFDLELVVQGSLIELRTFAVRRANRATGTGQVVYLAIHELRPLEPPAEVGETTAANVDAELGSQEGGFVRDDVPSQSKKRRLSDEEGRVSHVPVPPSPPRSESHLSLQQGGELDEADDFETIEGSPSQLERRRRRRQELRDGAATRTNAQRSRSPDDGDMDLPFRKRRRQMATRPHGSPPPPPPPLPLRSIHGPGTVPSLDGDPGSKSHAGVTRNQAVQLLQRPQAVPNGNASRPGPGPGLRVRDAPLHTLSSLLSPPPSSPLPSKNYSCSVFAVVSWVSSSVIHTTSFVSPAAAAAQGTGSGVSTTAPARVFRSTPKRHVKLHDPSVTSRVAGVTLAVFDDPAHFVPPVGTVALFRGLVMNRCRGTGGGGASASASDVILNRYPGVVDGLPEQTSSSSPSTATWFVDDPATLKRLGFDVEGMARWWADRSRARTQRRQQP